MKNLVELSKEEAIQIEGGGAYEIGYAIGSWCANVVDFWSGMYKAVLK